MQLHNDFKHNLGGYISAVLKVLSDCHLSSLQDMASSMHM